MTITENLRRVPILDGAVCLGLATTKHGHDMLVFASSKHREIKVRVASKSGGELIFSYVVADPDTKAYYTYQGPHGDPDKDQLMEGGGF